MTSRIAQEPRGAFVLIPGAGGMAWYWHRVVPLLQKAGHEAIAVDLPGDDPKAGLSDYADVVVGEIGTRQNVILVAQSLAGFTAPLVCVRSRVRVLAFVNAMIPLPGETAGAWWSNTGSTDARLAAAKGRGYSTTFDVPTYFLHDVPQAVLRTGPSQRTQADSIFGEPCRFERWPEIPIRVFASTADRFFPFEFQRRIARERLGQETHAVPGGHLVALARPEGLAQELLRLA